MAMLAVGVSAPPRSGALAQQGESAEAIEGIRNAIRAEQGPLALELALAAVATHPQEAWAQLWLGHAYRFANDPASALRAYLRAERSDPDNAEILMSIGEVLEITGNTSQARAAYERVIEVAPDVARAYRSAATLWMRAGDDARAAGYLARYVEMVPDDLDAGYLLGLAYYLSGDPDRAVEVLEGLLLRLPGNVPAAYTLGVVLADRPPDHERALELLRSAVAAGYEEANASSLVGRILADSGDFEAAVPELERSLEINPDQLDATYRLARAYARLGRREEGQATMAKFRELQQAFNEAEARDKRLKTAQNELAAAIAARDGATADRVLRELMAEYPEDPTILVQAAKVWLSAGDVASARDAAIAAGQVDPDNWEAAFIEGLTYHRDGRQTEALAALQRSLRANPVFADTWAVLGNVQMAVGKLGPAIDAYLAAIDLDADNPGYWLNLAAAYGRAGRGDLEAEALDTYKQLSERRDVPR